MLSFLTPWLLGGLGALAAPLLVHLVQKERKDAVPFPSLMFLMHTPYQSSRRQRIQHWGLFLLRCLAVVLLALAFARPFVPVRPAAAAALLPSHGQDIVIALDQSYSMRYGDRWRRAVAAAKAVVGRMKAGDRATVVSFAGTASAVGALTSEHAPLLAALDSLQPTAGGTRYSAVFRLAEHLLSDAQSRRELVLISDYQRAGWTGGALPRLPVGTTLTQVNVGGSSTADLAVAHVDVQYDTSAGRQHATVVARLANYGSTPVAHHPVTFELDGRPLQTQVADCPAHGVVSVAFDPVPTPPGLSRGLVHIGPDSLEPDNRFYFLVTQTPTLSVLLVEPPGTLTGTGTGTGPRAGGGFLTQALSITDRLQFRVTEIEADRFSVGALRTTALVILNGTPVPGGDLGQRLTQYVKDGGGLLVALGSQSRSTSRSTSWPPLADVLLPRPGVTVERDPGHPATLEFLDRGHAVFSAFTAPHSGDFSVARFERYGTLQPQPGDRQLARFDDGHLALLERRVGAGRVLVWSSDLDGVWNDLPLQPVFLPLVHHLVQYAAGYTDVHGGMTVGELLSPATVFGEAPHGGTTPPAPAAADYVAIAPSGTQTRFPRRSSGPSASLEVTESGIYELKRTGGVADSASAIAVNVDLAEADLTPLDTARFAAAVTPAPAVAGAPLPWTATPGEVEGRQRVWWYLLVLALLVLATETVVANRLSRPAH